MVRASKASSCQCQSHNSHGVNPSILRHSVFWGAADEALLNKVHKRKNPKHPLLKMFCKSSACDWKINIKINIISPRRINYKILKCTLSVHWKNFAPCSVCTEWPEFSTFFQSSDKYPKNTYFTKLIWKLEIGLKATNKKLCFSPSYREFLHMISMH